CPVPATFRVRRRPSRAARKASRCAWAASGGPGRDVTTGVDSCPFRGDVRRAGGRETAACGWLARAFGAGAERLLRVDRDRSAACCAAGGLTDGRVNTVLASFMYTRAHQPLTELPPGPEATRLA